MRDGLIADDARGMMARAALLVGVTAALLTLVLCVLLSATHLQVKRADPLNNATLLELRERYGDGERGEQVKLDIRRLDLLSRQAFFTSQSQIRSGSLMALVAAGVMLLAGGFYQTLTRRVPPAAAPECEGMFWVGLERSRSWVAAGTLGLVAVSVVLSLSTPTYLSPEMALSPPDPIDHPQPTSEKPVSVLPAGFAEQSPVFRGPRGNGLTDFEGVPTEWDEATGKNLLWKQPLALAAWASPVVWGERVVVAGASATARQVTCLELDTGRELWSTTVPVHSAVSGPYEPDTMDDRWDTLVFAGSTPAVNGKQVFTLFSNGQLVAMELATGRILWDVVLGSTQENPFGVDNSLLIYRDSVIAVFEGDERFIARYEGSTGRQIWKRERHFSSWASPILAGWGEARQAVVLPSDPNVTAWDPESGAELWSTPVLTGGVEFCVGPSAVAVEGSVYVNCENSGIYGLNLADGSIRWSVTELPDGSGFSGSVSMGTDGRHLFQYFESVLTALELSSGKVVLQKEMPEYGNYASPVVNRGSLYLMSEEVTTVVEADPANGFAVIGQGRVSESSDACPAVVAGRILLRADHSLYCFGEKP